jgi:hypothetical protein
MSISVTPPVTGAINVYQYEDISYAFTYAGAVSYNTTGTTQLLANLLTATPSNVVFYTPNYLGTTSSTEAVVINATDPSGNVISQGFPVVVNPGRFSNFVSGTTVSLYLKEPFTPIRFQTKSLAVNTPITYVNNIPTSLPVGLSFVRVASNTYDLSGIPLAQAPSRNFRVLSTGSSNSSFIVSTNATIVVNPERVNLDVSGSTAISGITLGTPISPVTLTARYTDAASGNLRYTWNTPPPDLAFQDASGNVVYSGFRPLDASSTMTLTGTPTSNTISFFRNNYFPYTITVNALRLSQPLVSNTQTFVLSPAPSVILDAPTFSTQYVGVPVRGGGFKASTYFNSGGAGDRISNMFSLNLAADLSTNFNAVTSTMTISGTPYGADVPGGYYTCRAINSNGLFQDVPVNIPILNDTVTFTTVPTDNSATFILSRPVTTARVGYYQSPLLFAASTGSGCNVTFTLSGNAGTGISLASVSANTVQLVGTPVAVRGASTLVVTASSTGTPATASVSLPYSIVDDVFTFTDVSVAFIQNKLTTPIQLNVSTLSERAAVSYLGTNLPSGISISSTGLLKGVFGPASTSGSFTVTASTGYTSGSHVYNYTSTPDNILFTSPYTSYSLTPGGNVSVDVAAVSYSGTPISNMRVSNLASPYYGLQFTPTSNTLHIGGTLYDGTVAGQNLPVSCNFSVVASVGALDSTADITLSTPNAIVPRWFVMGYATPFDSSGSYLLQANSTLSTGFLPNLATGSSSFWDFQIKNQTIDANVFMLANRGGANIYRSTDARVFTSVSVQSALSGVTTAGTSAIANFAGTTTWAVLGAGSSNSSNILQLFRSTDDGRTFSEVLVTQHSIALNDTVGSNMFRDGGSSASQNPYLKYGAVLRYDSNGTLWAGGGRNSFSHTILEGGRTLFQKISMGGIGSPTYLSAEVADINLDNPGLWWASGSSLYSSFSNTYSSRARTLVYSLDGGASWTEWIDNSPTPVANWWVGEIAYGSNIGGDGYIAVGINYTPGTSTWSTVLLWSGGLSSDYTWSNLALTTNDANFLFSSTSRADLTPPLRATPYYDTNAGAWNVMVTTGTGQATVYSSTTLPNQSNWTATSTIVLPVAGLAVSKAPTKVRLAPGPEAPTLTIATTPGGPVFTSPTASTQRIFYQYITITPIPITVAATGTVYYYAYGIPTGLTFDPTDHILRGAPMQTGTFTMTFFAKDTLGRTTIYTLTIQVIIPFVLKNQSGAGSYTSLLRQYTETLAAENARDNKVDPTQSAGLGEFMSPVAPNVITQINTCPTSSSHKPC